MNRYYRPSVPRYTSQFVEDKYPEDLIMQAGAMKYQQKQQASKDIAEFSAINNLIQAGYRTTELAPAIKQEYNQQLDDFVTRHKNDYDSPQALMELSKMRYKWMADPNVQLIKADHDQGNKEHDEMRKSKTYPYDYDPNINPQTKGFYQFNKGDSYKPHSALTLYEDTAARVYKELDQIEPTIQSYDQRSPMIDPTDPEKRRIIAKEVHVKGKVRSMKDMDQSLENMTDRALYGKDPELSFILTEFRDPQGRLRQPSREEVKNRFTELAKKKQIYQVDQNTDWKELPAERTSGSKSAVDEYGTSGRLSTPIVQRTSDALYGNETKGHVRSSNPIIGTGEETLYLKMIRRGLIEKNYEGFAKKDVGSQNKIIKDLIDQNAVQTTASDFNAIEDPKEEQRLNSILFGIDNKDGFVSKGGSAGILTGLTMTDLSTGDIISRPADKEKLLSKGSTIRVVGRPDRPQTASSPGLVYILSKEAGSKDSKYYGVRMPDLAEKEKPMWNLMGATRSAISRTGNVYGVDYNSEGFQFHDVTDGGTNGDQKEVAVGENGKYFVPFYTSKNEFKVRVYDKNPSTGKDDYTAPDYKGYAKEYTFAKEMMKDPTTGKSIPVDSYDPETGKVSFNEGDMMLNFNKRATLGAFSNK